MIHLHEAFLVELLIILVCCFAALLYIYSVIRTNQSFRQWPLSRTICWCVGLLTLCIAVVGPLANTAVLDFRVHMLSHLLFAMIAPLLLVLAAPMTLLLRLLPTPAARFVTTILKSEYCRIITHPIFAAVLNVGGLWYLYTTNLYILMHDYMLLHWLVHLHLFFAGYLFTLSIISVDPVYHKKSFVYRAGVLIMALACHNILAKYVYTHPPEGVVGYQAEQGSMWMYYGGGIIDAFIIFMLCLQWYKATRPRIVSANEQMR